MLKKISTKNLKIGHYVEKLDNSWFSTPFLFHQFKVKSQEEIQKLKDNNINEVYINTEKGLDIGEEQIIKEPGKNQLNYINVNFDSLTVNTEIPFDLYCKIDGEYTLYLKNSLPLHPYILNDLKERHIGEIYIDAKEKIFLTNYLANTKEEKDLSVKGLAKGFETPEKIKNYNNYLNNYIPLNSSTLMPGIKVPFAIFIEQNTAISMIAKADEIFGELKSGTFNNKNLNLLIRKEDIEKYKLFLREIAKNLTKSSSQEQLMATIIKENTKIITKELFDSPLSGKLLKSAKESVTQMVKITLENPSSSYELFKIHSHDYYTYVHSVNVCILSIGIGTAIGLEKEPALSNLAFGALLHDVGKSMIDNSLINKPGELTDREFKVMKDHVSLGEKLLRGHKNLPEPVFYPVKQHHERLSGTGYPLGLSGNKIDIFGRITAIADIYDTLTTERAYKKALTKLDTINYLAKNISDFDLDIFKAFVAMLDKNENIPKAKSIQIYA